MMKQYTKPMLAIYKLNAQALMANIDSITESECRKMPAENINSMNWILGHIVLFRDNVLTILGKLKLCSAEMERIYSNGNTATDMNDGLNTNILIEKFNKSQSLIEFALENPSAEALINDDTLEKISFYAFHETYHVGQTGIVRVLLKKPGAIKGPSRNSS